MCCPGTLVRGLLGEGPAVAATPTAFPRPRTALIVPAGRLRSLRFAFSGLPLLPPSLPPLLLPITGPLFFPLPPAMELASLMLPLMGLLVLAAALVEDSALLLILGCAASRNSACRDSCSCCREAYSRPYEVPGGGCCGSTEILSAATGLAAAAPAHSTWRPGAGGACWLLLDCWIGMVWLGLKLSSESGSGLRSGLGFNMRLRVGPAVAAVPTALPLPLMGAVPLLLPLLLLLLPQLILPMLESLLKPLMR
mmetsp:Transcript_10690/g.32142  ORF Transcript_10690/g.32142 Transcript_10690/m.32142 type:complete len:252 (-) Transcript_10690:34-789(-)